MIEFRVGKANLNLHDHLGFAAEYSVPIAQVIVPEDLRSPEQQAQGIGYYTLPVDSYTAAQKIAARRLILEGVEWKIFDQEYSTGVALTAREFDEIIMGNKPVLVLAISEKGLSRKVPEIVGYASGIPALAKGMKPEDVTTLETPPRQLLLPHNRTFLNDTIAVLPNYRGKGIGKTMYELRKAKAFSDPSWNSLAVLLLHGARSKALIEHDPDININALRRRGLVSEGPVRFQASDTVAHYMYIDFSKPIPNVPLSLRTVRTIDNI